MNEDILDGILKLRDPGDASPPQAEMLPYQPTPTRHMVELIYAGQPVRLMTFWSTLGPD